MVLIVLNTNSSTSLIYINSELPRSSLTKYRLVPLNISLAFNRIITPIAAGIPHNFYEFSWSFTEDRPSIQHSNEYIRLSRETV